MPRDWMKMYAECEKREVEMLEKIARNIRASQAEAGAAAEPTEDGLRKSQSKPQSEPETD